MKHYAKKETGLEPTKVNRYHATCQANCAPSGGAFWNSASVRNRQDGCIFSNAVPLVPKQNECFSRALVRTRDGDNHELTILESTIARENITNVINWAPAEHIANVCWGAVTRPMAKDAPRELDLRKLIVYEQFARIELR